MTKNKLSFKAIDKKQIKKNFELSKKLDSFFSLLKKHKLKYSLGAVGILAVLIVVFVSFNFFKKNQMG